MIQEIYFDKKKNEIGIIYNEHTDVCIGETDEGIESFFKFMEEDFVSRGISKKELPKIRKE